MEGMVAHGGDDGVMVMVVVVILANLLYDSE